MGTKLTHNSRHGSSLVAMLALLTVSLSGIPAAEAVPDSQAPTSTEAGSGWVDYESQPLRVNVWQDKEEGDIYRRGEEIRAFFEVNQDAYAVLYRIDADGEVVILWPRSRYDDGFVFGHHEYSLPAAGGHTLRTSSEEGVEYIEAIVSLYPFDLRELAVDFHHERTEGRYAFRIAGDPFLAMNEVNYAVTGLDDPADYVVTNYTSYYVHQKVDHPRYLCSQCHDDDLGYEPYHDTCTVQIHHDYGWSNRWYVSYGYYPIYHYPCYYYVDPWSWRPWVNYWYTPWYHWPRGAVYTWPYDYYAWHDSPYYVGDVWVRYKDGHRRYAPLSRSYRSRAHERESYLRRGSSMVSGNRPNDDVKLRMRDRTSQDQRNALTVRGARPVASSPTNVKYRNTERTDRSRAVFRNPENDRSSPGLRIRGSALVRDGRRRPVRAARERMEPSRSAIEGRTPGVSVLLAYRINHGG